MSKSSRIAILAGAGLSMDAGLPSSIQLSNRLRDTLLGQAQAASGGFVAEADREQGKRWLALFHFLNGGIRFQEGVLNRNPDAPVNIEQLAVAAEELHFRKRNPLAPYAAGWHQRLVELEGSDSELLPSFLDFIYGRLQEWLTVSDPQAPYYLERLTDLSKFGQGIDIFTLNYDVCIETALSRGGHKFVNGFNELGEWNPATLIGDESIQLFKLHGSLDWVDDQKYGICCLQYPRHESAETIQTDETRPLLIFGTAHKLSAREPFLTLAYHFAQRVLQTDVLAVVGYSFGDSYINQIIEQGMRRNTKLRLVVVSPAAEKSLIEHPAFVGSPRVQCVNEKAQIALDRSLLRNAVKKALDEVSTEAPF